VTSGLRRHDRAMGRRPLAAITIAALVVALAGSSADARPPVQRRGPCATEPTRWGLTVQRGMVPGTLRIRFVIRVATPGDAWQVALSDGPRGLPAVDRVVGANGGFRVVRVIRNGPGPDRIMASATNKADGTQTCLGAITF